jgi:ribosomal protein S18 acetylase RimI-like enzyme
VVLTSEADVPIAIEAIVGLGYIHKGTRGVPGRESFNLPEGLPAHHLYLVVAGSRPHLDHVLLRDLLRRDRFVPPSTPPRSGATPICCPGTERDTRMRSPHSSSGFLPERVRRRASRWWSNLFFDGVTYRWRAQLEHEDVSSLVAAAFGSPPIVGWFLRTRPIALGWVSAHEGKRLVGFVNVAWDGGDHASIFDTAVLPELQHRGIGSRLVGRAAQEARRAGCRWLHVDFEAPLADFYFEACGFRPTAAGLIDLELLRASRRPRGNR